MAANQRTAIGMPSPPPARMVGVENLLGRDIFDLEGRRIGELHDVVLDLESGRIAYVFIALNQRKYSDQCVMAPWSAILVEAETQRLVINKRVDPIEQGPAVKRGYATERFAND